MNYELNLEQIDVDGAIGEATDAVSGDTRMAFLRKAGIGAGAMVSGGAILGALAPAAFASGRPPAKFGKGDIGILNYALTLEYLEAAFYNGATAANMSLSAQTAAFLKVVTKDENAHVAYLKKALGSKAVAKPKFDFKGMNTDPAKFMATAFVLENTGVHAYSGQALNITSPKVVAAALSIVTIEARHASVIGLINNPSGGSIAPNGPFDTPYTAAKVLLKVKGTGFIV
ncbi:MAG TPA: ferritin-like domain-containing protein [Solirubrobacteraceae bacterium]